MINYKKKYVKHLEGKQLHVFYFFIPLESQNEQQFVEIELSCLITEYDYSITAFTEWAGCIKAIYLDHIYYLPFIYLKRYIPTYINTTILHIMI
jgi:hypothetical protein